MSMHACEEHEAFLDILSNHTFRETIDASMNLSHGCFSNTCLPWPKETYEKVP